MVTFLPTLFFQSPFSWYFSLHCSASFLLFSETAPKIKMSFVPNSPISNERQSNYIIIGIMNVIFGRFLILSVGIANDAFIRIDESWMSHSPQAGHLRWQGRECIFLTFSLACLLPLPWWELNPSALTHYCYFGNLMCRRQVGTRCEWTSARFNLCFHHSNIVCSMSVRGFVSASCCRSNKHPDNMEGTSSLVNGHNKSRNASPRIWKD